MVLTGMPAAAVTMAGQLTQRLAVVHLTRCRDALIEQNSQH